MEPLISLDRVSRSFPMDHSQVAALEEVSLRVTPGEFLAVADRAAAASPPC
ncbi:MAG TPA: hypothetical protein VGH38_12505 [Bryobacteraceae bacterium]